MVPDAAGPPLVVYQLAHQEPDHFLTGWRQTLRPSDLATVRASHAGATDQQFSKFSAAISTVPQVPAFGFGSDYSGPFHRTEHYYGPGFVWAVDHMQEAPVPGFPGFTVPIAQLDTVRDYRPGQRSFERWNQAPFAPGWAGPTLFSFLPDRTGTPVRDGDTLRFASSLFSDQAIPARGSLSVLEQRRSTLRRGAQIISESHDTSGELSLVAAVPPERAEYRLEHEVTRPSDLFELSTRVAVAWTFHSQHAEGALQALALPIMRFLPVLDEHNRTAARVLVLPIQIERPVGVRGPDIARASAEASFDDGATWSRIPIVRFGDHALGLVVHPPGATHVSLRGAAADVAGNQVEQTIIRAYGIGP
jgi:hypothetical protein